MRHWWLRVFWGVLLAGGAAGADEGDWPRFRGPNGQGVSTAKTVPVEWTAQDYRWTVTLPGRGHSSPVTWGDRVFITCGERKTARRSVLCLQAADGAVLWKQDFPSERHHLNRLNSYASATPCVDGERVYLRWSTPKELTVAALDFDGKELWRRDLGPFDSEHGGAVSPIVYDGLVIVGNDQRGEGQSFLAALDAATGDPRWRVERESSKTAYATPVVYRPADGPPQLIFLSTSHGVTGVDPGAGAVNWELADAFRLRVVASPVVASGLIIGTCQVGGRGRRLVAVRPGSRADGTPPSVAWELKHRVPAVPVPVAKDGRLFLWTVHGRVSCLRAATGEFLWEGRILEDFFGSPVWVEGRLYCISRKGVVYVVDAGGKDFKLLSKIDLGERSHATPAIGRGVMYLRTESLLMALGGAR